MRQQGTEHSVQNQTALSESDGKFSILFYPAEEVRYGLPIFLMLIQSFIPLKLIHFMHVPIAVILKCSIIIMKPAHDANISSHLL